MNTRMSAHMHAGDRVTTETGANRATEWLSIQIGRNYELTIFPPHGMSADDLMAQLRGEVAPVPDPDQLALVEG